MGSAFEFQTECVRRAGIQDYFLIVVYRYHLGGFLEKFFTDEALNVSITHKNAAYFTEFNLPKARLA
jgi:hypothetical protein